MRLLALFVLMLLIPAAAAEVNHNPQEVDDGDLFQTWIDVNESYDEVKFYVCTLAEPFTCYAPQKVPRDEAEANGDGSYRYSFSHQVGDGVYPGYRYELCTGDCKDDNRTKTPAGADDQYPGLEVVDMNDSGSYYFKVERKAAPSAEDEGLPALALPVAAITIAWVARRR
ncbi:MAG: hypothetical protein QF766_02845 [Candidatus Poseidoniia archaeon]|jgi:hypothetical protein|nr:hypothetical protein [Euryarchaeota archaeon]MDP7136352.1 hypothetical protein [Candidatus Poseidoniia archaeon]MDP7535702.1 hypothetical protein [Candidatus Poseidoniia archaeon]MDP7590506.1 hypothetical protein [Candidatus Poseidoniia archaeon]MDP7607583.1 hypothetical protein [Candidatus Poseidoniia archaeon]